MAQGPLQHLTLTPWFLVAVPEVRPDVLERPRLSALIASAVAHHPIVVVEALSGFGKSTALASWARGSDATAAWLTLTQGHAIPRQLLTGITAALLRVCPDNDRLEAARARLRSGEEPLPLLIESIIDALPEGTRTTIILDDAHETSRDAVLSTVVPLARYSGGRLRFVLSGIGSVSRWLVKELARGEAHRLSHSDLRFSRDEMVELAAMAGIDIDVFHENGRCLWEETRGWPVAVRLLLQAEYRPDADVPHPLVPNIIADYIETEVIDALPAALRSFVLDATATDRVSPSYVAHLTGDSLAPALLEECRSRGLFLERLRSSDGETSLRWQAAFAQSCREIAKHRDSARFDANQRKTAEWMVAEYPTKAIHHAFQVNDPGFAISMIEDVWLQMITIGHASLLESRCLEIPVPETEVPSLLYIRACCRALDGDASGARLLKARADSDAAGMSDEIAERTAITRAFADLLLLSHADELLDALAAAERILESARLSRSFYIHGTFLAGWTHLTLRHSSRRHVDLLTAAAASAEKAGFTATAGRASAAAASALTLSGRFSAAEGMLADMMTASDDKLDRWEPFDGGLSLWAAGFMSFWRGRLDHAARLFRRLDAVGAPASSEAGLARMYFAYCAALSGEPALLDEASSMLERLSDEEEHGVPWPSYKCVASASLHWARGDRSAAVTTLDALGDHVGATTTRAIAAGLWRRLGYPAQALRTISTIDEKLLVSYSVTAVHLTRAAIAWERGDRDRGHSILERSLDAADREGVMAPFIRMGDAARDLLLAHASTSTRHETFIASILTADGVVSGDGDCSPTAVLTEREREVFRYLSTSMTAEEIAVTLFVSPSTVRSHQRSIYRKLGVTNRRDAVRAGTPFRPGV